MLTEPCKKNDGRVVTGVYQRRVLSGSGVMEALRGPFPLPHTLGFAST